MTANRGLLLEVITGPGSSTEGRLDRGTEGLRGSSQPCGAWFIGPDGRTLARMASSTNKNDSKELVLRFAVPIAER